MADPISVISLIEGSIGLVVQCGSVAKTLSDMIAKFKHAEVGIMSLEGFTYQMDTPIKWTAIGLDLKLVKRALNDPPRASESGHPGDENSPRSVPTVGCFPGPTSPALGPAL